MNSQQFQQPALTASQSNKRRWQWLGIGVISSIAAATIAFSAAPVRNPQALLTQPSMTMRVAIDPATQSVNDYLRAHATVDRAVAIDPAVQGVNDYLRAHASVRRATVIDPAGQGVSDSLRAPATVDRAVAIDPAAQGVNDYLQAHAT